MSRRTGAGLFAARHCGRLAASFFKLGVPVKVNPSVLVAANLVLPGVWGWLVYRLVGRIWPRRPPRSPDDAHGSAPPADASTAADYQI